MLVNLLKTRRNTILSFLIRRSSFPALAILVFTLFCPASTYSQSIPLLDSLSLDTARIYTDLSLALKDSDNVIRLSLRKQKLKEMPLEILKFKNLQYLDLSKNSIKELPPEIGELKNLQYFSITKTGLEIFPPEIGKLTNLKWLIMNQNEMILIPPQIGNLINLEYLDLWSNNLDHFPDEMKNLKKLKTLDLRVILINDQEQGRISEMLPATKIFFSANCNCKN
jgi:Leucine-rich repeat (LRR) protein